MRQGHIAGADYCCITFIGWVDSAGGLFFFILKPCIFYNKAFYLMSYVLLGCNFIVTNF